MMEIACNMHATCTVLAGALSLKFSNLCKLTFKGEKKYKVKVEKLIKPTTDITILSTPPEVVAF